MISIIIAHDPKRANGSLVKCLSGIERQISNPSLDYEILIADQPGISYARNETGKNAKGEILVFIDDNVIPRSNWLHELVRPFQNPQVAVVGGPSLPFEDASEMELLADKILGFPLATFKSANRYRITGLIREVDEAMLDSSNLAIRRSIFEEVGGFADLVPCEGNVMMNKIQELGYKMIYNPFAIVHHQREPLFLPYWKKIFWYGKGRGKMMRRYGFKGRPRILWCPSLDLLKFLVGFVGHYAAYISGIIWGLIKG